MTTKEMREAAVFLDRVATVAALSNANPVLVKKLTKIARQLEEMAQGMDSTVQRAEDFAQEYLSRRRNDDLHKV